MSEIGGGVESMRLQNRTALVTGGSRGIGDCIVRTFVREGAAVLIADVLDEEGERLASELRGLGARCAFVHTDVTDEDQIRKAAAETIRRFGGLHIAIADAGWMRPELAVRLSEQEFTKTFDVCVKGTWLLAKHVIPSMKSTGGGSFVAIASIYGRLGVPGRVAYGGAKAAVSEIVRVLAVEYGPSGVRVNSVSPGAILTEKLIEMHHSSGPTSDVSVREACFPLRRLGREQDVANAVLFLASDESAWITGADLVVDGGLSVQSPEPLLFPPFRKLWDEASG